MQTTTVHTFANGCLCLSYLDDVTPDTGPVFVDVAMIDQVLP